MPIPITCSRCRKRLRAKDEDAGKTAKCPECGQTLQVPRSSSEKTRDEASAAGSTDELHHNLMQVECRCGKRYRVLARHTGKRFTCPACGMYIVAGTYDYTTEEGMSSGARVYAGAFGGAVLGLGLGGVALVIVMLLLGGSMTPEAVGFQLSRHQKSILIAVLFARIYVWAGPIGYFVISAVLGAAAGIAMVVCLQPDQSPPTKNAPSKPGTNGECPSCGYAFDWDGKRCGWCSYPATMTTAQSSEECNR